MRPRPRPVCRQSSCNENNKNGKDSQTSPDSLIGGLVKLTPTKRALHRHLSIWVSLSIPYGCYDEGRFKEEGSSRASISVCGRDSLTTTEQMTDWERILEYDISRLGSHVASARTALTLTVATGISGFWSGLAITEGLEGGPDPERVKMCRAPELKNSQ